jgi:HSP20 family molecular chaperone IbpA
LVTQPRTVSAATLYDKMQDLDGRVIGRAEEIARERGAIEGFGIDDWFRAESEILRRVSVRSETSAEALVVRADLPGVSAEDIEVGVEPRVLVIGVRGPGAAFRVVDLRTDVDPAKAVPSFSGGVLTLFLPRRRGGCAVERAKRPA